ncbi:MAG: adenine nucleotide alpha hydrolase family protein [Deltaproteobacteria bacterium]|nr:adenine nucleotide alpha hydrolase family protein [Deltaproteobacteria bacterium]
MTLAYAASRGKKPIVVDLRAEGVPIPEASRRARKEECSVCGTVKRYFFNRIAADSGFTAVATGHNLDDEAARLLGNLLHWDDGHLSRQHPLLPESEGGLVRKVKPLWRVSEVETASYGFLKGIDFVTEECPMSEDATSLVYKEALSLIEEAMPGTRRRFYQGFLKNRDVLKNFVENGKDKNGDVPELFNVHLGFPRKNQSPPDQDIDGRSRKCITCGAPTYAETCSYCRLKETVAKARRRTEKKSG